MKRTSQLQKFIAGFLWKPAPDPEPETVDSFHKKLNRREISPEENHEIWRTCNSCGDQWDAIIDGYSICPKCGSTDLRSGKAS